MIRINGTPLKQEHFPDNSLLLKTDYINFNDIEGDSVIIEWYYENDAELFTLICIKRYLDPLFGQFFLWMPYIPHARQDRVKELTDVFTLKYFCEVINSLHFDTVFVRDAHSNVSLALLDNVLQEPVQNIVTKLWSDLYNPVLFFPDEGASKRYSSMFKAPHSFGIKKRDWATGKILGLDLVQKELVNGKDVLIIDDICSKGGTFYHSAKALKEAGAKDIYLYVTHLEKSVFDGEMYSSGLIKHIYTTKSIFPDELVCDNISIIK